MDAKLQSNEAETYEGLVGWLKQRRDDITEKLDPVAWDAIDSLLDEAREAGAEGFLPWQQG